MKNYMVGGYTTVGKSHADKGIKCQDSCYYDSNDNIVIAAIADGLSSSKHSDVASQTVVKFVVNYCIKNITEKDSEDEIIAILKKSFDDTLFTIKQIARAEQNDINDYDTTLTVAVLIDDNLYYGQIGDSGIVALLEDGRFERVTEAQNGEGIGKDRPVYPLAAISKWSFKKYEKKIKALFLATDGVLKNIQHPLLERQKYTINHRYLAYIYTTLFSLKDDKEVKEYIKNEVEKLTPEEVDYDDKTLVVVINRKCSFKKQPDDYYNFPTDELWKNIQKQYETELYPYRNQENDVNKNDLNIEEIKSSENYKEKIASKNNDDGTEETTKQIPLIQKKSENKTDIEANKKNDKSKLIKKENKIEIYILKVLLIILCVLLVMLI